MSPDSSGDHGWRPDPRKRRLPGGGLRCQCASHRTPGSCRNGTCTGHGAADPGLPARRPRGRAAGAAGPAHGRGRHRGRRRVGQCPGGERPDSSASAHVAVLDARLPDGSGIDVCRSVHSTDPNIRALILTSYDDEALFAAILADADGYVLKQIDANDLVVGLRRVASGQSLIDPALTARVLERLRRGPEHPEELAALGEQERKMELIAEGMTNRQIGEQLFLAEKTVKNYVSKILAKLGLERRTQAAVLAAKTPEAVTRPLHLRAAAGDQWPSRSWPLGTVQPAPGVSTLSQQARRAPEMEALE